MHFHHFEESLCLRVDDLEELLLRGSVFSKERLLRNIKGPKSTLNVLQQAQKFFCGNAEEINDVGGRGKLELQRLPYPLCAFEFGVIRKTYGREHVEQLILIAAEADENRLIITPHYRVGDTPGQKADPNLWLTGRSTFVDRKESVFTFAKAADEEMIDEATESALMGDAGNILSLLMAFLRILNCRGMTTTLIDAPEKLNRKRLSKGKRPIYSYHVLAIRKGKEVVRFTPQGSNDSNCDAVRIHLRRGHIKRRKTGDFWWQPCVVGRGPGIVVKDYDASRIRSNVNEATPKAAGDPSPISHWGTAG